MSSAGQHILLLQTKIRKKKKKSWKPEELLIQTPSTDPSVDHWKENKDPTILNVKISDYIQHPGQKSVGQHVPLRKNLQMGRGRIFLSEGSLTSPSSRSSSCTQTKGDTSQQILETHKTRPGVRLHNKSSCLSSSGLFFLISWWSDASVLTHLLQVQSQPSLYLRGIKILQQVTSSTEYNSLRKLQLRKTQSGKYRSVQWPVQIWTRVPIRSWEMLMVNACTNPTAKQLIRDCSIRRERRQTATSSFSNQSELQVAMACLNPHVWNDRLMVYHSHLPVVHFGICNIICFIHISNLE